MAMAGENCVALAVDKRFGSGPQTINVSPRKVLIPHSRVMVSFVGLEGDIQSVSQDLSIEISNKVRRNLGFGFRDEGNKDREIKPKSLSILLSHLLYRRRNSPYYVEPIIAGLEKKKVKVSKSNEENPTYLIDGSSDEAPTDLNCTEVIEYSPFLCRQDLIGAQSKSSSFVCTGTASKSLYGTAEAMWRPGLGPEELVKVCGRAVSSALERDCLSGYGIVIYLMVGGKGIEKIELEYRND